MRKKLLTDHAFRMVIAFGVAVFWTLGHAQSAAGGASQSSVNRESTSMKIRLHFDDQALPATLENTPAARDFLSLLPLTLTLEDYADTEKIAYLPRKLSTRAAPDGATPRVGDITYYAPWGNLAIFHRDFRYSPGLVHLGRIDGNIDALWRAGKHQVTITVAD